MLRVTHLIEGVGIQSAISQELVTGAVKLIRPGSRDDVYLTTTGAAHLSRVASCLHLEFLHGVGRGAKVESIKRWIGVGRPVEQEIVGVRTIATDADRRALTGTPIERTHVTSLGAMTFVRSRHGEHQINQQPTVKR